MRQRLSSLQKCCVTAHDAFPDSRSDLSMCLPVSSSSLCHRLHLCLRLAALTQRTRRIKARRHIFKRSKSRSGMKDLISVPPAVSVSLDEAKSGQAAVTVQLQTVKLYRSPNSIFIKKNVKVRWGFMHFELSLK